MFIVRDRDRSRGHALHACVPGYICASFLALCLVGCGSPETEQRTPASSAKTVPASTGPNVVLLILDTLRADALGSYGNPLDASPALDKLAQQGVQFDKVLAQCSWTRPSTASFITSQYPRTVGIYLEKEEILPDSSIVLAEVLKEHGYTTIGLTSNPHLNRSFNFQQGFDEYVDSRIVWRWMPVPEGAEKRGRQSLPTAPSLFKKAIEIIDKTGNDGPYYVRINLMEPHEWVVSPNRPYNMLRPEYQSMFKDSKRRADALQYFQLVRQLTDDIGAFVEQITAKPGWDDTLFVFVSDHGEGLRDHPGIYKSHGHGRLLYETILWVPWIMYRKGWSPNRSHISQQVRLLEMMPTLLDYLDIPAPPDVEGKSLMPLINGTVDQVALPEFMVAETQFRKEKTAVYGPEWKYIRSHEPEKGLAPIELQARGLGKEKGIVTNQIDNFPEASETMKAFLAKWEKEHKEEPPTLPKIPLSDEELELLKSLGYTQ